MNKLLDKLEQERHLNRDELRQLLTCEDEQVIDDLYKRAQAVSNEHFKNHIYIRGLIEFSNYCKQNCYYCGLRRDNREVDRYRLTKEEILECCEEGYELGFRTFVLQSGEDEYFTPAKMVDIIEAIRSGFPDCAITVSVGEKNYETYKQYFDAGADRFLLRHETITPEHYNRLHPEEMNIETRVESLHNLKKIGFQTGSGIMVGSPGQTIDYLIDDIYFLEKLKPEMIGIGPYLPSKDTPFKDQDAGSMELTIRLIALFRLMHPSALIPATTALATIHPTGREKGILAGANVVMPNLSPLRLRKKYQLYDDKACTGDEAAHCIGCLGRRLEKIGYQIEKTRGDFVSMKEGKDNV